MKKTPLEYALYLVQIRDRTESEIRKKMTEKSVDKTEMEKTIQWLKDKKFIDDERFVQNYIRNKKDDLRSGRRKVEQKLYHLGVSRDLIEAYLSSIDPESEYEKAKEIGIKWIQKNSQKEKKYEKLGRFLAGRGYDLDVVKQVLAGILK